jgi:predicted amidophosphoribosyltransferase
MRFDRLDGATGLSGTFTIAYRLTDDGMEHWSRRLNRFKSKDKAAFAGAGNVLATAVSRLLQDLKLDPNGVLLVPALSSRETEAVTGGWLTVLSRHIARKAGAEMDYSILSKKVHRSIHTLRNAGERDDELDKAEYTARKTTHPVIFVVDDFITRGATASRIAAALKVRNEKCRVFVLALGKTDRTSYAYGMLNGKPNDHVPDKWDRLWGEGESMYEEHRKG